jgi:agmatine deiminase
VLGEYANHIQYVILPTDDIWVRDYGPISAYTAEGQSVVFDAIYDHLPKYPQTRDDEMPRYWAAYRQAEYYKLDLHTEGGNLLTDGAGTLLMTERIFEENTHYTQRSLEDYLHQIFDFEKIIYTPRMRFETTGHIDLLIKLASAESVLVSAPDSPYTDELQVTHEIFRKATNAQGNRYHITSLPTPPLYRNWFTYPIRRSYTNSLTVNGRVLVPIYGVRTDEIALRRYEEAMPDHQVIPIDCKIGANGGGAVHCLTKEVPR